LVAHSADGQIETVKYQVLDSMLLNEVQRQQAEIRGSKSDWPRWKRHWPRRHPCLELPGAIVSPRRKLAVASDNSSYQADAAYFTDEPIIPINGERQQGRHLYCGAAATRSVTPFEISATPLSGLLRRADN